MICCLQKQNINIENHRLKEEILLLRKGIADDLDKTAENAGFAAKELMSLYRCFGWLYPPPVAAPLVAHMMMMI